MKRGRKRLILCGLFALTAQPPFPQPLSFPQKSSWGSIKYAGKSREKDEVPEEMWRIFGVYYGENCFKFNEIGLLGAYIFLKP
jgi:hypothetical protein